MQQSSSSFVAMHLQPAVHSDIAISSTTLDQRQTDGVTLRAFLVERWSFRTCCSSSIFSYMSSSTPCSSASSCLADSGSAVLSTADRKKLRRHATHDKCLILHHVLLTGASSTRFSFQDNNLADSSGPHPPQDRGNDSRCGCHTMHVL